MTDNISANTGSAVANTGTGAIPGGVLPSTGALRELADSLARPGEPGLAIGVYADGELAASATAGCAVPEHDVPVTEHTAFDIASVSKHMTSACLLLLARDGQLDLDADVRAVLPELVLAQPVTLRQCLTHTSGLRDYFSLCELAGLPVMGMIEDQFADLVAGQRELDFAAGSAFSYSNTGYALAALVVRRVSGHGLAAFARERLFGPLGMTTTHFRDDVGRLVPGLANGYLAGSDGVGFRRCDVTEEVVGDGAVVTTIADLPAWHAFMATGAVLGTGIRDGLLERAVLTSGARISYALGLEAIDVGGSPGWWHSGSWAGYRAGVVYLPSLRAGVNVLANRNDWHAPHVALAVAQSLVTGADPRERYAALTGTPAAAEAARAQIGALAGRWHEADQDVFLEFTPDGDRARLRDFGGGAFRLCDDGSWHGTGTSAAGLYTMRDGSLYESWGLRSSPEGRYERVASAAEPGPPAPAGIFANEELRVYADLSVGADGDPAIVIGLAPARLVPVGPGVWHAVYPPGNPGSPVTVRAHGDDLLISLPPARRVRFDRVMTGLADRAVSADGAVPRGLRRAP